LLTRSGIIGGLGEVEIALHDLGVHEVAATDEHRERDGDGQQVLPPGTPALDRRWLEVRLLAVVAVVIVAVVVFVEESAHRCD